MVGTVLSLLGHDTGICQDTTRAKAHTDTVTTRSAYEMDLGTIEIVAEVEKPSATILPKRILPKFGEVNFIDRAFDRELNRGPKRPTLLFEELESVKKVQRLKKLLAKRKK